MNQKPLMQQVLGEQWHRLAPVIRAHYDIIPGSNQQFEVVGEMDIEIARLATPLIKLIYRLGGLVDRADKAVRVKVIKYSEPGRSELFWHRELRYPDGEYREFRSTMRYAREGELHEFINHYFGLRLQMSEEDGDLVYRSRGHLIKVGTFEFVIPDHCVLGKATIREHALSDRQFALDFRIEHPLWDRVFGYRGTFELQRD